MLGRSSHGAACSPRAADVCRVTAASPLARRAGRDGQGALASGSHPGWATPTAAPARVSRRVTRTRHCVSPVSKSFIAYLLSLFANVVIAIAVSVQHSIQLLRYNCGETAVRLRCIAAWGF